MVMCHVSHLLLALTPLQARTQDNKQYSEPTEETNVRVYVMIILCLLLKSKNPYPLCLHAHMHPQSLHVHNTLCTIILAHTLLHVYTHSYTLQYLTNYLGPEQSPLREKQSD